MIYTKYVWTLKAQTEAEKLGMNETRPAGSPASLCFCPLERTPETARRWLNNGYIEKVEKELSALHFTWRDESALSHMIKALSANGLEWYISKTGQLVAAIGNDGEMVPVEYCHVHGNYYEIIRKPRSTSEYFGFTPEELYEKKDGHSREFELLTDNNIHEKPFAVSLKQAIRKARDYVELGCTGVEVLQCINNQYAVVSH